MKTEIRMSFVLMREDIPPLFDELQRFPKGPRRINRLRILAYAGLAAMQPANTADGEPRRPSIDAGTTIATSSPLDAASLEFFGPPLK
ncbi:hypothetical protein [Janthinobacterium sp. PSPC3-1]|uniref:hypothetical protein n=1 Tax=Janthinobacterium sp. PSPC3-1 TaxID=2804653 RepID=UPI003CF31453